MKVGVGGTQNISFGSRGSGLRCTTDAPIVTDPTTPSTLYIGCNVLSRSTNRGTTWTTIAPANLLTGTDPPDDSAVNNPLYSGQYATISTIAPSGADPNTIYVGTDTGRLWKTTDLGVTWQEFANPFAPNPPRWVTSVIADPVDASHAYASFGGFREGVTAANVFETTSAGDGSGTAVVWKNISGNLPNAPVNFLAYDRAHDTVYAATDFGVYFMQNDDKVWTKLGDNLPNTATEDVKIQASSGQLYVGTFGRGTWRIPLVAGTPRYNSQAYSDLTTLRTTISGMGLNGGVSTPLINSVNAAQKSLKAGNNVCSDLSALKTQIAGYVPKKITTAQQTTLDNQIDAIRAEPRPLRISPGTRGADGPPAPLTSRRTGTGVALTSLANARSSDSSRTRPRRPLRTSSTSPRSSPEASASSTSRRTRVTAMREACESGVRRASDGGAEPGQPRALREAELVPLRRDALDHGARAAAAAELEQQLGAGQRAPVVERLERDRAVEEMHGAVQVLALARVLDEHVDEPERDPAQPLARGSAAHSA